MKSGYYMFPAIRGIQAGREYYVSMCPLRLLPKMFLFDEDELVPELRAQRQLNRARLPEMARYIYDNPQGYIFSAITASIDAQVKFDVEDDDNETGRIGILKIPMSARFVINDGQHRRAAIELALREKPELGDETIAVVFFLDVGLERSQQMFADLNRYAIRPSNSLSVFYDHRDEKANLTRKILHDSTFYRAIVEPEKTTLSARSQKLFTLSALYHATSELTNGVEFKDSDECYKTVSLFWHTLADVFKEWKSVQEGVVTAGEIRADYIHTHGVVLQALGKVGNSLLKDNAPDKFKPLRRLAKVNWRRSNADLWEGRAMTAGRVSKSELNVLLTSNAIKSFLGIALSPDEQRVEDSFNRGDHAKKSAA